MFATARSWLREQRMMDAATCMAVALLTGGSQVRILPGELSPTIHHFRRPAGKQKRPGGHSSRFSSFFAFPRRTWALLAAWTKTLCFERRRRGPERNTPVSARRGRVGAKYSLTLRLTHPSELPTRFLSEPIRKVRTVDWLVNTVPEVARLMVSFAGRAEPNFRRIASRADLYRFGWPGRGRRATPARLFPNLYGPAAGLGPHCAPAP